MRTHFLFLNRKHATSKTKKGRKSKPHSIRNRNKQELRWEHKAESDSSNCGHEQHEMKNNSKVTDSTQERTSQYNWHAQRKQTDTRRQSAAYTALLLPGHCTGLGQFLGWCIDSRPRQTSVCAFRRSIDSFYMI